MKKIYKLYKKQGYFKVDENSHEIAAAYDAGFTVKYRVCGEVAYIVEWEG